MIDKIQSFLKQTDEFVKLAKAFIHGWESFARALGIRPTNEETENN